MSYISSIRLSEIEWLSIEKKIGENYPPSVLLLRFAMQRELGFTTRRHTEWTTDSDFGTGHKIVVYLDFYSEEMKTLFILTYL
jgi:hypothetical protein